MPTEGAAFFDKEGARFYEGSSVFVAAADGPKPFIARIRRINEPDASGGCELDVRWWYRPDDPGVPGGRQPWHGDRELLASDHVDTIHSDTIIGPCVVHTLAAYNDLPSVTALDYFWRFKYRTATKQVTPPASSLPLYCSCRQPENPDRGMVACDDCEEWFHPECQGTTLAEAEALPSWNCSACASGHAGRPKRMRVEREAAAPPGASAATAAAAAAAPPASVPPSPPLLPVSGDRNPSGMDLHWAPGIFGSDSLQPGAPAAQMPRQQPSWPDLTALQQQQLPWPNLPPLHQLVPDEQQQQHAFTQQQQQQQHALVQQQQLQLRAQQQELLMLRQQQQGEAAALIHSALQQRAAAQPAPAQVQHHGDSLQQHQAAATAAAIHTIARNPLFSRILQAAASSDSSGAATGSIL